MKTNILSLIAALSLGFGVVSCSQNEIDGNEPGGNGIYSMNFRINHPDCTRATETAFENGDKVGLFIRKSDLPLEIAGNFVNNEALTCNGIDWQPGKPLFWDNGTYCAHAYYPYMSDVSSIEDLPFNVRLDQDAPESGETLSGYEASDFLYASAKDVKASSDPVNLIFKHIMSKMTIRLIKGEDFEGELPENATVLIHNTVPEATIDLSVGIATRNVRAQKKTITACKTGRTSYAAIIVPQRLDNRVPLVEVIMNGVSYLYESKFIFKPGIHHLVNLVVDKNPEQIKIEIGGEIVNWN